MPSIQLCSPTHPEFTKLVAKLDAYLAVTDGEEHGFYDQFNSPSTLDAAIILLSDERGIGCAGYRIKPDNTVELKRMFVTEDQRGSGAASELLSFLEETAKQKGFKRIVLETGVRQVAAVKFYERSGYVCIENYPPYVAMENSVCYEKVL
ncbi:MAG: GNAT family N-acetyltransferase [Saprospiraceae bacterium]